MQKYDIFLIYKYFLLFHCASWQFFIMAVGSFSLWQLATFHYASWQFFIMVVGNIFKAFPVCRKITFPAPRRIFSPRRRFSVGSLLQMEQQRPNIGSTRGAKKMQLSTFSGRLSTMESVPQLTIVLGKKTSTKIMERRGVVKNCPCNIFG